MRWAWIYVEGFRLVPKVLTQYRTDTIATVVGDLIYRAVRQAFIGVIFAVTPQLGQWTAWEVMLMWSMAMLADAIGNFLFAFPNKVDSYFYTGQFDYARVRPVPIVLWANLDAAHPRYAMVVITFVATTAVAAVNSGIFESLAQTGLLLLALVCTVFVLTGMRLIMFLSCAWFTRSRQFFHGIASFMDHSRYPIDIMGQPLRGVLNAIPIRVHGVLSSGIRASARPVPDARRAGTPGGYGHDGGRAGDAALRASQISVGWHAGGLGNLLARRHHRHSAGANPGQSTPSLHPQRLDICSGILRSAPGGTDRASCAHARAAVSPAQVARKVRIGVVGQLHVHRVNALIREVVGRLAAEGIDRPFREIEVLRG